MKNNQNANSTSKMQNEKNIEDLYQMCLSANPKLTQEEFEKFLVSCYEKIEKTSEEQLENIAGGKSLDKHVSKKIASLVLGTLAAGSAAGVGGMNSASAYTDPGFMHIYKKQEVADIKKEFEEHVKDCRNDVQKILDAGKRNEFDAEIMQLEMNSRKNFFLDRQKFRNYANLINDLDVLKFKIKSYISSQAEAKEEKPEDNDNKDVLKNQDQAFQNYKINLRTGLSMINKNLEVCMRDVQDISIDEAFGKAVEGTKSDIKAEIEKLDAMVLPDDIRNDNIEIFNTNLDAYFSDVKLQLDSLKYRSDKLVKDITSASDSIKKQVLAESRDRFSNQVREIEQKITDEFTSQDIEDEYLTRIEELRREVTESHKKLSSLIDKMESIDNIQEIEREFTLFNARLARAISSKNDVVNRFREKQKAERKLEAKSDFNKQLELLRSGQLKLDQVVGGYENAIKNIEELIDAHVQRSKTGKGIPPKGMILYGEPGTGKTTLVNSVAAANKLDLVLLKRSTDGTDMEVEIRKCFNEAKTLAAGGEKTVVLLIDEIDALGSTRIPGKTDKETVALLAQLDALKPSDGVVVLATTNMLTSVDNAVKRSGRLEELCEVSRPQEDEIRKILKISFNGYKLEGQMPLDEFVDHFVGRLRGCCGADIKRIAERAVQHRIKESASKRLSDITLYITDVEKAISLLQI